MKQEKNKVKTKIDTNCNKKTRCNKNISNSKCLLLQPLFFRFRELQLNKTIFQHKNYEGSI